LNASITPSSPSAWRSPFYGFYLPFDAWWFLPILAFVVAVHDAPLSGPVIADSCG
jgi:hypothetical protein